MHDAVIFLSGVTSAVFVVLLLCRATGFSAQRPADYATTFPGLDPTRHLSGGLKCEGMIHGPRGRVDTIFTGSMEGEWHGRTGVLKEHFSFTSGGSQTREWRFLMGENGRFTAEADDIEGLAEGEISGATMVMRYRLRLPVEAGAHLLKVTDWIYLTPSGTLLNRSEMRKYGFKVADLTAAIRPLRSETVTETA